MKIIIRIVATILLFTHMAAWSAPVEEAHSRAKAVFDAAYLALGQVMKESPTLLNAMADTGWCELTDLEDRLSDSFDARIISALKSSNADALKNPDGLELARLMIIANVNGYMGGRRTGMTAVQQVAGTYDWKKFGTDYCVVVERLSREFLDSTLKDTTKG